MVGQPEKTATVVSDLFAEMDSTVSAYDAGAIRATRRVNGTAFFPGGIGLWRGEMPDGAAPIWFPSSPIMILGHNFDKVAGLEASWRRGIELMEGGTWLILRRYLEAAKVDPLDCFFTNVFMGLQPTRSVGDVVSGDKYKQQCRTFLRWQLKRVKPRLVVALGIPAAEQYRLSGCDAPFVSLYHPLYAFSKGRNGEECASIVAREGAKLNHALISVEPAVTSEARN